MLSSKRKPNKHEKFLIKFLKVNKFGYKFVGDGKVFVAGFCPDFVHTAYNLIIEYDGTYWHSFSKDKDRKRNSAYRQRGFRLLIIRTKDLRDENKLLKKVIRFEEKYKTSATRRPSKKR